MKTGSLWPMSSSSAGSHQKFPALWHQGGNSGCRCRFKSRHLEMMEPWTTKLFSRKQAGGEGKEAWLPRVPTMCMSSSSEGLGWDMQTDNTLPGNPCPSQQTSELTESRAPVPFTPLHRRSDAFYLSGGLQSEPVVMKTSTEGYFSLNTWKKNA